MVESASYRVGGGREANCAIFTPARCSRVNDGGKAILTELARARAAMPCLNFPFSEPRK